MWVQASGNSTPGKLKMLIEWESAREKSNFEAGKLHMPNFQNLHPSSKTYFNDSIVNKITCFIHGFIYLSFLACKVRCCVNYK